MVIQYEFWSGSNSGTHFKPTRPIRRKERLIATLVYFLAPISSDPFAAASEGSNLSIFEIPKESLIDQK